VKLNNHASRLQIDTGAGGLLVSRSVARHAGLIPFSHEEVGGIGDEGDRPSFTAYADSIRIGNLEFQDCAVEVMDGRNAMEDEDGLIGMDVFSDFLVTLDYPMRKLLLGPLPPRPGEPAGAKPQLNTADEDEDDSASAQQPATANKPDEPIAKGAASGATAPAQSSKDLSKDPPAPASKPAPHGPCDRYIAPEMKDYTAVYRVGHDLILPASLNGKSLKLFILDTGAWATTISPQAAREVTKLHGSSGLEIEGLNGKVDKVYSADEITFNFAHLSQKNNDVTAFDTSKISKGVGMEISGFIGATTLNLLTIHIDYRDGLVKFDYDPKRGYRF
jgi:predicted aspartyl protease